MAKLEGITEIELLAFKSKNLDTICFRGSAPLAHLALISQSDTFDQVSNPKGLQRDLSPKHASDAYDYTKQSVSKDFPRAYPEVVLNVRDTKVVEIEEIEDLPEGIQAVRLRFNLTLMRDGKVSVSRVDGNHRLFFVAGDTKREPLFSQIPFQIHIGLKRDQESSIFVDINSNQKGLNTSHLAMLQSRLTEEELEIRDHLDRWIAKKLSEDPHSPWYALIHHGGSKEGSRAQGLARPVNFVSLKNGTAKMLSKSQYIHDLTDPTAQYVVIRNYWHAVKKVYTQEWAFHKRYLLLKNIGVWSFSILGGTIIDRCLPKGKVAIEDMVFYLNQTRGAFSWDREATGEDSVAGMSGNRAAMIIAGQMAEELTDESGTSGLKTLQQHLRDQLDSGEQIDGNPDD
ncbi:MAG: DGQHR domain-containing protein [Syntrophobacteraceae bacterium]